MSIGELVGYNVPGVSFQCTDKILERTAQVLTVVLTLKKKDLKKGNRTRWTFDIPPKEKLSEKSPEYLGALDLKNCYSASSLMACDWQHI